MNIIGGLRLFVLVAERQNFSKAAKSAGLTPGAVSTQIRKLEDHFGLQLLFRNSRHVTLTEDGEFLQARARNLFARIDQALNAVSLAPDEVSGLVRIQAMNEMSRAVLMPALASLAVRYPRLCVELYHFDTSAVRDVQMFDLSMQLGGVIKRHLTHHRLSRYSTITAAAAKYLEERGEPQHPSELEHHDCLTAVEGSAASARPWSFERDGQVLQPHVTGPLQIDAVESRTEAAVLGYGIVNLPDYLLNSHIKSGRLTRILKSWRCPSPTILLATPHVVMPVATRAVFDFIKTNFPPSMSMLRTLARLERDVVDQR